MAEKDIIKHGDKVIAEINDRSSSEFEAYETYSRKMIDQKLSKISTGGSGNSNAGTGISGYDWSNRLICFDGDSLTAGSAGKFSTVTINILGCSEKNIAQGGKAIFPDEVGAACDFRQRVSRIPHNVDLIFICGDFNAAWSVAKTMEDCFATGLDTWAGRWNAGLAAIKKSFPNVPVMLVSPWTTAPSSSKNKHILQYNSQAMLTFARYWGCYFMDFSTETPMQLNFGHAWWSSTGLPNVHNNQRAADLVGMVLADRIKTIPAPEWSATDSVTLDVNTLSVAVGGTGVITPTLTGNYTNAWTSSDNNVACVLGGTVYGMSAGTATITCTTHNGVEASCVVTVS